MGTELPGEIENDEEEAFGMKEIVLDDIYSNNTEEEIDSFEFQKETKSWLDWCRSHSSVKCTEYDVPSGILPKGYNGVLIDVKVGAGKKRVPDDKIYMAHADLRVKVARGNCVLELNKIEKGKITDTKYVFFVFALKKFSGGLGDEDDQPYAQSQWAHYFIKNMECTKKVVCTGKENGEAAHISSRRLFGQSYFCIGSKNVHMLVKNEDDILKYNEGRFEFARRIAISFFMTILNAPENQESKQHLITFLQNNQYTAVAEIIQPDHQHVVNLSHLKHSELRFICWTKPDLTENFMGNTLCAMPVNEAIDKAREFGFKTVDYKVIEIIKDPTSEIEQLMLNIRKDYGHEGNVLYFLDSDNCTIGLIKKKTAWYILLRALREKVAAFASSRSSKPLSEKLQSIVKRINAIQTWLGFSDEYAKGWIELSTEFARWMHLKHPMGTTIRSNFPVIFEDYLVHNPEQRTKYHELLNKYEETNSSSV